MSCNAPQSTATPLPFQLKFNNLYNDVCTENSTLSNEPSMKVRAKFILIFIATPILGVIGLSGSLALRALHLITFTKPYGVTQFDWESSHFIVRTLATIAGTVDQIIVYIALIIVAGAGIYMANEVAINDYKKLERALNSDCIPLILSKIF